MFDSSLKIAPIVLIGSSDFGHVGVQSLVGLRLSATKTDDSKKQKTPLSCNTNAIDSDKYFTVTSYSVRPRKDSDILVAFRLDDNSKIDTNSVPLSKDKAIVVKTWFNEKNESILSLIIINCKLPPNVTSTISNEIVNFLKDLKQLKLLLIVAGARLIGLSKDEKATSEKVSGEFAFACCDTANSEQQNTFLSKLTKQLQSLNVTLLNDQAALQTTAVGDSFINSLWLLCNVAALPASLLIVECSQATQPRHLKQNSKKISKLSNVIVATIQTLLNDSESETLGDIAVDIDEQIAKQLQPVQLDRPVRSNFVERRSLPDGIMYV